MSMYALGAGARFLIKMRVGKWRARTRAEMRDVVCRRYTQKTYIHIIIPHITKRTHTTHIHHIHNIDIVCPVDAGVCPYQLQNKNIRCEEGETCCFF